MNIRVLTGNIAWSMLSQVLYRGSLTLTSIILARSFGTREFAEFGYFNLTVASLAMLSVLGLGTAASRTAADIVHGDRVSGDAALGLLWLGSVIFAGALACLILVMPASWIDGGLQLPPSLLAAGAFVTALQAVPAGALLGLEEFKRSAQHGILAAIIAVGGALLSATTGNISIAMYGVIAASLTQAFMNSELVFRRIGRRRLLHRSSTTWALTSRTFHLVLPLAAASAIVTAGMWLVGRIILAGKGGHEAFALYAIGLQWFALAMFLPANMGSVLLPQLVRLRPMVDESRRLMRYAVLSAVIASTIVAAGGALFEPLLLGMYGAEYSQQTFLIAAYLLAAVVTSPVTTLGNAMLAHDLHWKRFFLFVVWVLILIGSAWLLRDSPIFGGAMAITLAYGFISVAMWFIARQRGVV